MTEAAPLVSLLLPTYNGAATLRQALDSLVRQDYPNIELLVADDASSDETPAICREYAEKYPFIDFRQNPKNLGSYGNILGLLRRAQGKYVVWTSQDDYWAHDFVSTLVAPLEADPDCIAAAGATRIIWDDTGEERYTARLAGPGSPLTDSYVGNAIAILTKRGKHPSVRKSSIFMHGVLRREPFLTAIETFPGMFANERQIICQLALAGRLVFVDRILFTKRARRQLRRELYPDDPVSKIKGSRFKYIYLTAISIVTSRIVPFRRKLFVPLIVYHAGVTYYLVPSIHRVAEWVRPYLPKPLYLVLKRLRSGST